MRIRIGMRIMGRREGKGDIDNIYRATKHFIYIQRRGHHLKVTKGVDMGILSPLIWPLYESGAIIPILLILLILGIILVAIDLVSLVIFIPIGIGLIVAWIIQLRK